MKYVQTILKLLFFPFIFFLVVTSSYGATEPNNACNNSGSFHLIDAGEVDSGWETDPIGGSNSDNDYYRIVINQNADVRLRVEEQSNGSPYVQTRLYAGDCSSTPIYDSNSNTHDVTNNLAPGTYFVRINRTYSGTRNYRIRVEVDIPDPSESCPGIVIPNLDGASSTVTYAFNNESVDGLFSSFYYFSPAVNGEFRIDFDSDNNNRYVSVRIYDNCGNLLQGDEGSGDRVLIQNVLANHLIVAEVYRRYDSPMNYDVDFTFTVLNDPPVFTSTPPTTVNEGDTYSYTPTATDADPGDTPIITLTSPATLPGWLTWDGTTLSGTPGPSDTTDLTVTFSATDGKVSVDQTFPIIINNKPVATDGSATTKVDTPVDVDLTPLVSDDGTVVPPAIITTTSNGDTVVNGMSVTFTPATGFDGSASFVYYVIDDTGLVSNKKTITIIVNPNQPPVANDKTFTTSEGSPISGNAITGWNADTPFTPDSDPDGDPLTLDNIDNTTYGVITWSADGNFTYTPNPGVSGTTETVSYIISDGSGGFAKKSLTFKITEANADLNITKTAPGTVVLAESFSYTLTVNSAAGTQFTEALNIVVEDTLPVGTTYYGYSSSGFNCTYTALSGLLQCTKNNMLPGDSETITIDVTAPNSEGNITNTAKVSATTPDSNSANNEDSVTTSVIGTEIDLTIYKTDSADPVSLTNAFEYSIYVENLGGTDASGIKVTDTLPDGVNFISATRDTIWDCAQPSGGSKLVYCEYIENGGVLGAGQSTPPLTIKVTAPAVAGTITNSATVDLDAEDENLSNNTVTEDTVISEGTSVSDGRPLTKYLQYNVFGDIKLIGNANVNYSGNDPNQNYNDNVNMRYVDTDSYGSTFNSSSSSLILGDPSYEIIWAGLYWGGSICSESSNGSGDGSGTGCDWSNSNYNSYNDAYNHLGEVLLKTPNRGTYITITANTLDVVDYGSSADIHKSYVAFADITHLIGTNEMGTYTAANIVLSEGQISGGGNFGGWALLFIYKDPNNVLHYKNVSVFNGFQAIQSDNNVIDIDGFVTPLSGPITASIAFYAFDGDPVSGGVARMREGKSNSFSPVGGDALNPTGNLFNSTIAEFGSPINTGVTKTYGIDADRIDVSSFMANDQGDTRFYFDVATPSGGVDWYTLSMFAFATDLVTPIINEFNKSATINNSEPAGAGVILEPGDHLTYKLVFENTGDEIALDVEMLDDFDEDNLTVLFELANFDASKIRLSYVNSTSWDPNANCGYDAGDHEVWCKIERVDVGDKYIMEFEVDIKENLDLDDNVSVTNTAYSKYKNATTGSYVVLTSNGYGGKSNPFDAGTIGVVKGEAYLTGPFVALDTFRWNFLSNPHQFKDSGDRNISTKDANLPFDIEIVSLDASGIVAETKGNINVKYGLYAGNTLVSSIGDFNASLVGDTTASFTVSNAYSNAHMRIFYCAEYDAATHLLLLYPFATCNQTVDVALPEYSLTGSKQLFYNVSDHFAVKPFRFNIIPPGSSVKAGNDFNMTFEALDNAGNPVNDFNESVGNTFKVTYTETKIGSGCKEGTFNPEMNASWSFNNGIQTRESKYDEVGNINITISDENLSCDQRFAKVDCDDKDVSTYWDTPDDTAIGTASAGQSFIPDHFKVTAILANHSSDGNFTYLSEDLNMSARLSVDITAEDLSGNTTSNYNNACYSDEIDLNISMAYSSDPAPQPSDLNKVLYRLTAADSPYSMTSESSAFNTIDDGNGNDELDTLNKNIFPAGDNNGSAKLTILLNFDRNNDEPVNPFDLNVTQVNALDTNNTFGTGSPDSNATFYFGRARPSRFFYDDISTNSVNTPVTVVVYCNQWPACPHLTENIRNSGQTDDPDWWLSLDHNETRNDGNITLVSPPTVVEGAGAPVVTTDVNITVNAIDTNVNVTCNATAWPMLNEIDLGTGTNNWLEFSLDDEDDPDSPFFKVRCIGIMDWAGYGNTGSVVETNNSSRKSKKLGW